MDKGHFGGEVEGSLCLRLRGERSALFLAGEADGDAAEEGPSLCDATCWRLSSRQKDIFMEVSMTLLLLGGGGGGGCSPLDDSLSFLYFFSLTSLAFFGFGAGAAAGAAAGDAFGEVFPPCLLAPFLLGLISVVGIDCGKHPLHVQPPCLLFLAPSLLTQNLCAVAFEHAWQWVSGQKVSSEKASPKGQRQDRAWQRRADEEVGRDTSRRSGGGAGGLLSGERFSFTWRRLTDEDEHLTITVFLESFPLSLFTLWR